MKISQLRAIYYAEMTKKIIHYQDLIIKNDLTDDFFNQRREWMKNHSHRYANLFYTIYLKRKGIKY